MFWIGIIVGVIIGILAVLALFVWSCHAMSITRADYMSLCNIVEGATMNRESHVQVWHDDELIGMYNFEEN